MGWERITADRQCTDGPALLSAVLLLCSGGGGDITIYEGLDTSSGRMICRIEGANNVTNNILFNPPIPCPRGIYVDVGSNVSEALIMWLPPYDK